MEKMLQGGKKGTDQVIKVREDIDFFNAVIMKQVKELLMKYFEEKFIATS